MVSEKLPTMPSFTQSPSPIKQGSQKQVRCRALITPLSPDFTLWKSRVPGTVFTILSGLSRLMVPARHFFGSRCGLLGASKCSLVGGPVMLREEEALITFDWCQVVIQFAYTAFTAGPVSTRLAVAFTHRQFHVMELVPDPTVEHLAYVAKCPQLEVNIGAVFTQTLLEIALHHRAYI